MLSQVNVELPLRVESSEEVILKFRNTLEAEFNMSARTYYHNGKWWVRCSAQIYNEVSRVFMIFYLLVHAPCLQISDFEKVGEVLSNICKAIEG